MEQFRANIKGGFKYFAKRQVKKILQPIRMPEKDKGKLHYFNCLKKPINDNYIFYEAFAGLGILDNSRAIFKQLLSDSDFADFTHVWSVDNIELAEDNIKEYSNLPNVIIVKRESMDYYEYLATSKYLISNSTFGYYFEKRPSQVYINTWHGVPTKYMGYEHAVERVENARGPARNYLAADYVVSANRFMTDIMYRRAYKLEGLFNGRILETGHPRSDAVLNTDKSTVLNKLEKLGIDPDKKIILYAPTWKGKLYNQLDYDVKEFKDILNKLSEGIHKDEYQIYIRVHYFLYKILAKDPELEKLLIPFTIDTNELLSVVDILISDYSSIFFDFLATNRPMVFYVPDLDEYQSGRGLYVPVNKLPGLVSSDIEVVSDTLKDICTDRDSYLNTYSDLKKEMDGWCIYNDDGTSSKRLIDIVFKGTSDVATVKGCFLPVQDSHEDITLFADIDNPIVEICGLTNNKKRLLICINTRCNNDSFFKQFKMDLLKIDYQNTDVTLLVTSFKEDKFKEYFNTLPSDVRVLVWYALPFVTPNTSDFFKSEVARTLGNVQFDEVQIAGNITEYWAAFANAVPIK